MRGWMWNEESCCQSGISRRIISRQGKHHSHDKSDDIEELEFGTKSDFIVGKGGRKSDALQ